VGPVCLRRAALRNLSLCGRVFLPFGTHICVCFVAPHWCPSVCVSTQQGSLSVHGALHILGLFVGSPGSCSVLLLRVTTLPSAGRTTTTVADQIRGKHFVNFYFSSHIVGFIKSMMMYGAERRLTWGEANSGFVGKSEVITWPVNRWNGDNTNCYDRRMEYCGIDSRSSGSLC